MMNSYEKRYHSVRIETASQQDLVLMAYDGIIRCLQKAQSALELQPRDIEAATQQLVKIQQIIEVLLDGLDFDAGKVAQILGSFYEFLRKSVIQANITKDPAQISKALSLIQQVKGFWLQSRKAHRQELRADDSPNSPSFSSHQ